MNDMTFLEWLDSTDNLRACLMDYAKSPLPADASERHADMDRAIQNGDDAGRLVADAEGYLIQAIAQAVMEARRLHPDLNSKEREAIVKDSVRHVQRLVDGLAVTDRSIKSRQFAMMNAGRSR